MKQRVQCLPLPTNERKLMTTKCPEERQLEEKRVDRNQYRIQKTLMSKSYSFVALIISDLAE